MAVSKHKQLINSFSTPSTPVTETMNEEYVKFTLIVIDLHLLK